eukprot:CAMPEP_0114155346 /NCGR_PEP_ID=MMETSP0043_2-20121206/25427_1 /TAXON_ID=464988 /ORGANISM="Hemiselmis andersenii, Strain CCMP644" /LENGTH=99 /DNA_ID=CAMNT_0001250617 /DNA_START=251 /DNA_END=550 /DNA_ORIENTATION=-
MTGSFISSNVIWQQRASGTLGFTLSRVNLSLSPSTIALRSDLRSEATPSPSVSASTCSPSCSSSSTRETASSSSFSSIDRLSFCLASRTEYKPVSTLSR